MLRSVRQSRTSPREPESPAPAIEEELPMFISTKIAAVLMLAIGLLAPSISGRAHAQAEGVPAEVTIAVLGSTPVTESPDRTLVLLRISLAPGAVVPAHGQLG